MGRMRDAVSLQPEASLVTRLGDQGDFLPFHEFVTYLSRSRGFAPFGQTYSVLNRLNPSTSPGAAERRAHSQQRERPRSRGAPRGEVSARSGMDGRGGRRLGQLGGYGGAAATARATAKRRRAATATVREAVGVIPRVRITPPPLPSAQHLRKHMCRSR